MTRKYFSIAVFLLWAVSHSFAFGDEESRDPFQTNLLSSPEAPKQNSSTPEKASTQLEGIGIGPKKTFAIINGETYHEGEQKGGIKVVQVRRREVDILMYGAPMTLLMTPKDEPIAPKEPKQPEFVPGTPFPGLQPQVKTPESSQEKKVRKS